LGNSQRGNRAIRRLFIDALRTVKPIGTLCTHDLREVTTADRMNPGLGGNPGLGEDGQREYTEDGGTKEGAADPARYMFHALCVPLNLY
jgi:hypothetical protein